MRTPHCQADSRDPNLRTKESALVLSSCVPNLQQTQSVTRPSADAGEGQHLGFRDESAQIEFALEVIATARRQRPELFDANFGQRVTEMIREAADCELTLAEKTQSMGLTGLSISSVCFRNPLTFMDPRRAGTDQRLRASVSGYHLGVTGEVAFEEEF